MDFTPTKTQFFFAWLNSRRLHYITRLAFLFFAVLVLLRLGFYVYFGSIDNYLDSSVFFEAIYIGLKFDLRMALLAVLPVLVLEAIPKPHPLIKRFIRFLAQAYILIAITSILLIYFLDFGYYAYLNERINVLALQFLDDASISANMVWQTYPVIWISLALLFCVLLFNYFLSAFISPVLERKYQPLSKFSRILGSIIFGLILLFSMYGKLSRYPLRWSDAFFSNIPFANSMALNPILYFYDTLSNKQQDFNLKKAQQAYPVMAKYLGLPMALNNTSSESAPLNFSRKVAASHDSSETPPNIIYVILESFGSNQYGLLGNNLNSTPFLDKLGSKGLVFKNFLAPTGGNTARSVFTLMTGIPDVSPKSTASHNPLLVDQHLIMNDFSGYEKYYFLGGSANWRNIRGFLTQNIQNLNLYEEGSYTEPRIDVWGISDLSLFRESAKVFRNRDSSKPFIAVIQTSANHKPFTIPEDNDGFIIKPLPENKEARQGYKSQGRYNAVRFLDHAVGQFIKSVAQEDYFDNTIFVFHGDHGSYSLNASHMSAAYNELGLDKFMTPLIIYSPKLIPKPQLITLPSSEVDVFPTIAGIAGIAYTNQTMGRDLFNLKNPKQNYVPMISNFRPEGLRGVMGDRFLLWRDLHNKIRLHDMQSAHPKENVKLQYPEVTKKMTQLGDAMFETARYMLHFNKSTQ